MGTPSKSISSSLNSTAKLKTLFQTFIFSHIHHPISRAFDKAKSFLLKLAKDHTHFIQYLVDFPILNKKNSNKKQKKLFFGSFRLHYNWCSSSSHVMPLGQETYHQVYYDSCWNSVVPTSSSFDINYHDHHGRDQMQDDDELSRYLQWLEEEKGNENIDKLADLFIANCHEKFRLEKQESYRRFQEMLARSV